MSNVLVVIPTLNEEKYIAGVLRDLMSQQSDRNRVVYIVSDGGSSDHTKNIVSKIASEVDNVKLLDNPLKLQSAGVNLAVEIYGEGFDYIVRCDAHSHYPSGFIDKVVDSALRNNSDSIVVPMDSVGQTCFQRAVAWISDTRIGSGGSAHRGGRRSGFVDHGHHALFKLDKFRLIGGYDETFTHNEDAEYDARFRLAGGKIYLDCLIRLQYEPRASSFR